MEKGEQLVFDWEDDIEEEEEEEESLEDTFSAKILMENWLDKSIEDMKEGRVVRLEDMDEG